MKLISQHQDVSCPQAAIISWRRGGWMTSVGRELKRAASDVRTGGKSRDLFTDAVSKRGEAEQGMSTESVTVSRLI
jgi:hypothetical protein